MRKILQPSFLLLLIAAAACAGNTSSPGPAADTTGGAGPTGDASGATLRIENRSNRDMDIYIRPQARGPVRVGFVPGGETASFKLSPAMVSGASSFRIEARPLAGGGSPTRSEPFSARAGEETFWSIPP